MLKDKTLSHRSAPRKLFIARHRMLSALSLEQLRTIQTFRIARRTNEMRRQMHDRGILTFPRFSLLPRKGQFAVLPATGHCFAAVSIHFGVFFHYLYLPGLACKNFTIFSRVVRATVAVKVRHRARRRGDFFASFC